MISIVGSSQLASQRPVAGSQKPSRSSSFGGGALSRGEDGEPYAFLRLFPHPKLFLVLTPVTGLVPLAYLHRACKQHEHEHNTHGTTLGHTASCLVLELVMIKTLAIYAANMSHYDLWIQNKVLGVEGRPASGWGLRQHHWNQRLRLQHLQDHYALAQI